MARRPAQRGQPATVTLSIKVTETLMERIDSARGEEPASGYARKILDERVPDLKHRHIRVPLGEKMVGGSRVVTYGCKDKDCDWEVEV